MTDVLGAGQGVHGPRGAGAAPARAAAGDAEPRLRPRPLLPEALRLHGPLARGCHLAGGPVPPSLHHQGGPPGQLPLRAVRGAHARGGAGACLLRDDGRAHGGRLHAERHQDLEQPGRPHPRRGRRHQGRRRPDRLRVRAVHRGLRAALRGGAAGGLGHPHLQREHGPPDQGDDGFQDDGAGLHAVLRAAHRRHAAGDGDPGLGPVAPVRAVRLRALVGRHAAGDRGQAGDRGHRQLRAVRDHRTRGVGGVPGAPWAAHQRGPLPGGGRSTRTRCSRSRPGRRESW